MGPLRRKRHPSRVAALVAVAAALAISCDEPSEILLLPVYPTDEPNLLDLASVVRLDVRAAPVDQSAGVEEKLVVVDRGERLSMDLSQGKWEISVQGIEGEGREVVYGETDPFSVAPGEDGEVRFFLGRTMAFNLVSLSPADAASSLSGLFDHTATFVTDSGGHQRILVAGGRRSRDGTPVGDALVIDPLAFTARRLPVLSCARAGHTALSVQTDAGWRVVLAGGDDEECLGVMEVYDPDAETFSIIDVGCGLSSTRGAVPELVQTSGDVLEHTGRVIVPGDPRCAVDILTGESVEEERAVDLPHPESPLAGAISENGQMLVLDPPWVFVDAAEQGLDCLVGGTWVDEGTWEGLEIRAGGSLVPLSRGRFLFAGGRNPYGDAPDFGWSILSVRDCEIQEVLEGARDPGLLAEEGLAILDLEPADGISVLATGGWDDSGEVTDRVALLSQPSDVVVPTWHDLSREERDHPVKLRRARAGHAIVELPDGTHWVIGGGESADAEIFVKGNRDLNVIAGELEPRLPSVTSVAVIDTTEGAESMHQAFADTYAPVFYESTGRFTSVFFVAADADRGIGDGLDFDALFDPEGCETGTGSGGLGAVVSGYDLSDFEYEDVDVEVVPGQGVDVEAEAMDKARALLEKTASMGGDCAWRQLLRVGLDGFEAIGTIGEEEAGIDPSLGVNVLTLVTSGDDCSQDVYEGLGVSRPDPRPAFEQELETLECWEEALDEYFCLPPPAGEHEAALEEVFGEVSWNPSELFVMLVGRTGDEQGCGGQYPDLEAPRRLVALMSDLEQMGIQTHYVDPCNAADDSPFAQGRDDLRDAISMRCPLQACVPSGITAIPAAYDDDKGAFAPVEEDAEVAGDVARRCLIVFLEQDRPEDDRHLRAVTLDDTSWWVATDSDRHAGCDEGWLVRTLEETFEGDVKGEALVCLR